MTGGNLKPGDSEFLDAVREFAKSLSPEEWEHVSRPPLPASDPKDIPYAIPHAEPVQRRDIPYAIPHAEPAQQTDIPYAIPHAEPVSQPERPPLSGGQGVEEFFPGNALQAGMVPPPEGPSGGRPGLHGGGRDVSLSLGGFGAAPGLSDQSGGMGGTDLEELIDAIKDLTEEIKRDRELREHRQWQNILPDVVRPEAVGHAIAKQRPDGTPRRTQSPRAGSLRPQ